MISVSAKIASLNP